MPRAHNNPGNYRPIPTVPKPPKLQHSKKLYSKGPHRKGAKVTSVLRDIDVLRMREDGMSYERISETLDKKGIKVCPATCAKIVERLITNILENSKESIEAVRELELRRLDNMMEVATKITLKGKKTFERLGGMDRILKIQERRAKLLGMDIHKVEHTAEVAVRIYHGIEEPPELVQLEASPPTEGEFTMVEGTTNGSIISLDSPVVVGSDSGNSPKQP